MGKTLVFGANGFIGQAVLERLLEKNEEVEAVIREGSAMPPQHKPLKVHKMSGFGAADLEHALKGAETVINLIGSFSGDVFSSNVDANWKLLDAIGKSQVRKVVFASSQAVYGDGRKKTLTESDPAAPVTDYGFAKYIAEQMHFHYAKQAGAAVIVARLSNVYGKRQTQGVVHGFVTSFLNGSPITVNGDGNQTRDFLHVSDAADGIISMADFQGGTEIFNLSGPENKSVNDLAATIKKVSGKSVKIKHNDKCGKETGLRCSSEKARRMLGFSPKVKLEDGIKEVWESEVSKNV